MSQKRMVLLSILFTLLIVAIPTTVVLIYNQSLERKEVMVKVYLTKEDRIIELPLEKYIVGVVASEMPAEFHLEALQAQSLAARTYIIKRLQKGNFADMGQWGEKAIQAHVSDTVAHQVYHTDERLKEIWGEQYKQKMERITASVQKTAGKIITYDQQPITAFFFSTSNGWTENSEDYFQNPSPYLRSVSSTWDRKSPKYQHQITMPIKEVIQKLEDKTGKKVAVTAFEDGNAMKILKRTEGKSIAQLQIGDQVFTGREVREALQLRSTDFQWEVDPEQKLLHIRTFGYGHGVGLSQWGANFLAKEGKKVSDIIKYYYQDVEIETFHFDSLQTEAASP